MAGKKAFIPEQALDAAMNLFWKQGYEASSIEDIVGATGLGRGSLYDTFGDKHALYIAALKRYLSKVPTDIEQDEKTSLKETLARYFQRWIDLLLADPERRGCFLVNATIEMAPCDAEVNTLTQSALHVLEEKFYQLLIKGQVRGELPWTYDPHQGGHFLLGILMSVRVLARAQQERNVLQDVVHIALSVFP